MQYHAVHKIFYISLRTKKKKKENIYVASCIFVKQYLNVFSLMSPILYSENVYKVERKGHKFILYKYVFKSDMLSKSSVVRNCNK